MKSIKNLVIIGLMLICLTVVSAACGEQTQGTEPADTTVASGDMDETIAETEKVTEEVTEPVTEELTTEEVTTEEVTTEELTTEEPTTEEPTTEEPTTEEPTTEAPVITGISAKVKGTHYIGDNLSAGDFTITVTYSDGSTKKNPAGWSADILNLSSSSTTITVSYQGFTTTVEVSATERPAEQPPAGDNDSADNGGSGNGNVFPYEFNTPYIDEANGCAYLFFNNPSEVTPEVRGKLATAYKDHFGKEPYGWRTVGSMSGFSNGSSKTGTVWRFEAAGYDLINTRRFWPGE